MFNTLRYAKMLEEVGFSRDQSETSVKILVEIMEDKLASKQDLQDLRIATQKDFQDFKVATQLNMQEHRVATQQDLKVLEYAIVQLESKLTIKMGAMLAGAIVILTALQKLI